MNTSLRPKRRRRLLRYFLAVGIVLACLLGVGQLGNWWEGVVFPGTQFFYTSDSTHTHIFRLTVDNSNHVVRVRIPPDYIGAMIPGNHWWGGYDIITLTAYLPDMVPEQVYDARDPLAAKGYGEIPEEQLLKKLDIDLSQSSNEPDDPSGKKYVTDRIAYAESHEIPLKDNPYSSYDAYLFADHMPQSFSDKQSTWTDYVPKQDKSYYIDCLGMPVSETQCSILFVYAGKIDVEVKTTSKNIPISEEIIRKVSSFLNRATEIHS